MACYKPITAWRTDDNEIVFKERGRLHSQLTLPCGKCIGCRLEYSRQWATRCMHEGKVHARNCALTLTYAPEHLPPYGNLFPRHVTLLLKRMRKALGRFRYFYCGEYGESWGRPHYHLLVFGLNFDQDRRYLFQTPAGSRLYRSPALEKLWPLGHATVGELNFESAAYTARYVMKKLTGDGERDNYQVIDPDTGEVIEKRKEFCRMSRRPGIGKPWFDRYYKDAYPEGKVVVRGHLANTPRYYDVKYKEIEQLKYEEMQYGRYLEQQLHAQHSTDERLRVREEVTEAKIGQLRRHNHRETTQ